MATTISDDEFMTTLTSLIDRPLWALSEEHFYSTVQILKS